MESPNNLEATSGESGSLQLDQSRFVMDGQLEAEAPQGGQAGPCKVDGEKRFDRCFRKNPARARYLAKRRAERFAVRFAGKTSSEPAQVKGLPAADHEHRLLIIGGLGHLGVTAIQPALEAMPPGLADCLDRGEHDSV